MELGLVGLGKMGGNMRERIRRAGHTVVGYAHQRDVSDVHSLKELVDSLAAPRVVWLMVPAGEATQSTVDELAELLSLFVSLDTFRIVRMRWGKPFRVVPAIAEAVVDIARRVCEHPLQP